MAPVTVNDLVSPAPIQQNHVITRSLHVKGFYYQPFTPKLWHRQHAATHRHASDENGVTNQKIALGIIKEAYEPYTPLTHLHAKITPPVEPSIANQSSSSRPGYLSTAALVCIVCGSFVFVVLVLGGLYILRSLIMNNKHVRVFGFQDRCHRKRNEVGSSSPTLEDKRVFHEEEFEDISFSLPDINIVYAERQDKADCEKNTPSTLHSSAVLQEAKGVAKRNIDDTIALVNNEEHHSQSPKANISKSPSTDISLVIQSRPRQGSDASASTGTTSHDSLDCFSVRSESSITSIATSDNFGFGDEGIDDAFEVKRAQSVEIKKGVLISCRGSSVYESVAHDPLPSLVIIEPTSWSDEGELCGAVYSSDQQRILLNGCPTLPSLSSLLCEGSPSTSLSIRTEEWYSETDKCLQPPIPYLIITRPSDSSIYTAESTGSSVSIDLNEFPLPPIQWIQNSCSRTLA